MFQKRIYAPLIAFVAVALQGCPDVSRSSNGIKVTENDFIQSFSEINKEPCRESIEGLEEQSEFQATVNQCLVTPELFTQIDLENRTYAAVKKVCKATARDKIYNSCKVKSRFFYYSDSSGVRKSKDFSCNGAGVNSLSDEHAQAEIMACRE